VPIRKFGVFASIGVLAGTTVMLLVLPSLLQVFPMRRWAARMVDAEASARRQQKWNRLLYGISRAHGAIVVTGILLLVLSVWGMTRIRASARLENLFRPGARILQDYEWLEANVGSLVPIEVIVNIPKASGLAIVERLKLLERVRIAVKSVDGVDCAVSAATFAPPLPGSAESGWRKSATRAVVNKKLDSSMARFAQVGYLHEQPDSEAWRISARVSASSGIDYGHVLADLEQRIDPLLETIAAEGGPETTAVYCGGVPLVHKAQDQLLKDLMHSFLVAFVIIAIAMTVLLRSVRAGLVAMIPNILPTVLVLGAMGWAGIQIEIGSLLTATAALGIAVDDTLHFIMAFRKGLAVERTRRRAILYAYEKCGAAMVQTSLICGLGLLVFSVSPFGPISRFGQLMAAMLGAALLGDLILLPAILSGRLGRAFLVDRARTYKLGDGEVAEAA
jgi:predicted RND superfamily exporter protein